MASLNEISYNILNIIEGGKTSDDTSPSIYQIQFAVNYYRALLLRRDFNYKGAAYDLVPFEQDLGIIDMELVDKAEDCDFDMDCDILRSTIEIPEVVRLKYFTGFSFLGAIDKITDYTLIKPYEAGFVKYKKYTSGRPKIFFRNNRIYIPNRTDILGINVRGVFSDPIAAGKIGCNAEQGECITPDSQNYPCAQDYIPQITAAVLSAEAKFLLSTQQDTINDANDNKRDNRQ